jgi:hypothetical protein
LSPAELLSLLAERARELRDAGVRRLQLEQFVAIEFAPAEEKAPLDLQAEPQEEYSDPLRDPATFPGGRIPQFIRRVNSDE